jgi:ubiquinone/menaquinone biosynthesis C-methylase UbiE
MAPGDRLTDHRGRTIDFGRQAEDYDRFRPGFPESFFLRLAARGWTRPGQRALDLGTGTGALAPGFELVSAGQCWWWFEG